MSSTPPSGGRLFVEPLEARIAPTGLTALANNTAFSSQDTYVTFGTQPSAGHLGFVPASTYLGASAPANLYAIQLTGDGSINSATGLSNGDKLLIFNNTTGFNENNPFLQATDKTLVAFFLDRTNSGTPSNDQVTINELVGISVTKKSSVNINGNVNGDIVTNLSKDGSTVSLTSVGKPSFNVAGLNINGDVTGDILAGGSINNVIVTGTIHNIFAGTSTNGHTFNFTGTAGTVTGTVAEGAFPTLKPGASITNTSFTALANGSTIHAGDGGFGALGGEVTSLTVTADTLGFTVLAGNGGSGDGGTKGGTGGDITGVTIEGVAGSTSGALITLHAGNGGENDVFKGGQGGAVSGVGTSFNSFDAVSATGTPSPDLLTQHLLIEGGDGGVGLKGGRGGDVTGSSIFSATPDDTTGTYASEIHVQAGHGGLPASATEGHGGAGGSVTGVLAEDQDINADGATATVLVQAGDGGAAQVGGTIQNVSLLGGQLIADAGNGGDGIAKGGAGGSLETITVLNLTNLFTHQLTLNAGSGGAASAGPGGAGGEINLVTMNDSDLNLLAFNTGTHANGGVGNRGLGGIGGAVHNITINDSDVGTQLATVAVRSGAGGNGFLGGGDGGDISQFQMLGFNFAYTATAGTGGSVLNADGAGGAGGLGGSLDTVGFSNVPAVNPVEVGTTLASVLNSAGTNYTTLTGAVAAGAGGVGTTDGGNGGTLAAVDLRAGFNVQLNAGAGGAGGSGAAGAGGGVTASAGVSLGGSVAIFAGNAAGSGATAGDGGSITSTIASAQTAVTMVGGSGGIGGAGGSITGSGSTPNPIYNDFNIVDDNFVTTPVGNFGNVTITGGAGSAANGVAGAGGSITGFTGSVGLGGAGDFSSAAAHYTRITAGAGGGGNGQTASGAGGSVVSLTLTGNNLTDDFGGQFVTVDGGNAGVSTAAKSGGAGGGVSTATIFDLDVDTVVQYIAAGDGASALKHGGAGGTIDEIHVGQPISTTGIPVSVNNIGVLDGATFGYGLNPANATNPAGGIFAGVGGVFTNAATAKTTVGQNGDVTNITANAIASIVAGKSNTIHLVHLVDGISLEGNTPASANVSGNGSLVGFDTAQVVGSIYNNGAGSTGAGASTFKQGDGLIAATTITTNRNFTPEASLTFDPNNPALLEFFDLHESTAGTTPTTTVTTTIPVTYSL